MGAALDLHANATATGNNGAGATTVVSAGLSTSGINRILLATIAIQNSSSQTVSSVSGGGLIWALIHSRSNGTSARVEVWWALASTPVSNEAVTATLSATARASIAVSAYSGCSIQGTNGVGALTAGVPGSGAGTTPSLSHPSFLTNSLITGHLSGNQLAVATAGSNQTINGQDSSIVPTVVQSRQDNTTSVVGTSVIMNYTLSASQTWAMVTVELISDGIQMLATTISEASQTAVSKSANTFLATTTFNSGVHPGSSIIVAFAMDDDGASPGTVSCADTAGTVYTKDVDRSSGGTGTGARVVIFSAHNLPITSVGIVTITHPSVTARAMFWFLVVGIDKVDQTASATGSGTSPSSGVTGTRLVANELLVGAVAAETPGQAGDSTFTAGTGFTKFIYSNWTFTQGTTGGGAASNQSLGLEFKIVSAVGTDAATATITSADWACAIATYRKASLVDQLVDVGSINAAVNLSDDLPSSFQVSSTIPETTDAVVTTTWSSKTAEGETPQQQVVIESHGGDMVGQSDIEPGVEVEADTDVAGATTDILLTGKPI